VPGFHLLILFSSFTKNERFFLSSSDISLPFVPPFTLSPSPDREDQGIPRSTWSWLYRFICCFFSIPLYKFQSGTYWYTAARIRISPKIV
jgi:hypothetical protein